MNLCMDVAEAGQEHKQQQAAFFKKLLLFVAPALALLVALAPLSAQGRGRAASIYVVGKVRLDVSADNAVLAKKKALRDGPLVAFRQMFRKIAPFRAYDYLPKLTLDEAEEALDGFSVRFERNSPTRYLALIDYSFSRERVEALMTAKGVPFFAGRSRRQLLMPVVMQVAKVGEPKAQTAAGDMQGGANMQVFGGAQAFSNAQGRATDSKTRLKRMWRKVWRALDLKHGLTDSKMLTAGERDLALWAKIQAGDSGAFSKLQAAHKGQKLVIVAIGVDPSGDRLRLQLFGRDQIGFLDHGQLLPLGDSLKDTVAIAARIAYGVVEGRWRERQIEGDVVPVSTTEGDLGGASSRGARLVDETVFLRVAFRGLRDWQQVRRRLQRVPGVRKMQINSLSPRGADVRLSYPGGVRRLKRQLSSYGFRIDKRGDDLVLSSTR